MIGQTVSHYKILEKLGEGGMGVVYKAEDTKLKRTVALKFLPPELTRDQDAKKRFTHEARAASALQHNNICTIHEIDETTDGRMFISMDCYEGETLKQRVLRAPRPVGETLDMVLQIVEGLAKAHEAGMVHRDVKPANVMVTRDGAVKILDFGLAKLAGQTRVTKTGTTVGTVAYMSPEQAQGKEIDGRTDIWSTGVVLYELLTGRLPFPGDHEAAVVYSIINTEPEPLSSHRTDIPEKLLRIIDKCLTKDVDGRYQNALELTKDLRDVRESITTRKPTQPPEVTEGRFTWSVSRRWGVLAIVALVVVAGVVTVTTQLRQPQAPPPDDLSLAIVDFRDLVAPDDPLTSAEITGLIHVGLVESSPIRVVSPDYLHDLRRRAFGSARGPIEEGQVLEIARECGSTLFLAGRIKRGDYVTWRLVETQSGKSLAARRVDGDDLAVLADQIIADVLPVLARESGLEVPDSPTSVRTVTTDSQEAYTHYIAGLLARQESRYQDAVHELGYALELDSTFALALFELSNARFAGGERGELVREPAEKAWQLRARLGIKDRLRLEAWRQRLDWRITDALATYREMAERWPDDREVLGDLTGTLFYFWYFEEAVNVGERGLELYPDDSAFVGSYWPSLALTGNSRKAIDIIRGYTNRHPGKTIGWEELGYRYLEVGLPDSAEAAFRKSLEIDPDFLSGQQGIAECAYRRCDVVGAIEGFRKILERNDLLPSQRVESLTNARLYPSLAFFFAEAGRFNEALGCFEEARHDITDIEREARTERNRGYLLLRAGKADEVLRSARALARHTDSRYPPTMALQLRAMALAALDSLDAARSASDELVSSKRTWGGAYVVLAASKVSAEIALAEGNPEAALVALRKMGTAPFYVHGLFGLEHREALARAQRMAGRLDEAAEVHEELLRIYGGHALSHYELGKIYQELGRSEDAKQELSKFLEMWSQADEGLPQLEDARTQLAALNAGS